MTVCKFYVQGYCRYGDSCRFDHPSGNNAGAGYTYSAQRQLFGGGGGGGGGGGKNFYPNKYKWTAGQNSHQQGNQHTANASDIINSLINDIKEWESNKMWPFSSVGLDKGYPCVPGFTDTSAEELRHAAYETQKSGNIQTYIQEVQKLVNEFSSKRQMLKQPSPHDKQNLMSLIEEYKTKKSKQSNNSGSSTALFSSGSSSGFGSGSSSGAFGQSPLSKNQSGGAFGSGSQQTSNPFGGSSAFGSTGSAFGSNTASSGFPATNPFGQQTTSNVSQNPFGGASGTTEFGQGSGTGFGQGSSSVFGQASASITSGNSVFGATSGATQSTGTGLFGKPASGAFGSTQSSGTGLFGKTASSAFGSTSGAGNQTSGNTSLFGGAQPSTFSGGSGGLFGNQGPQSSDEQSSKVYTAMDKLSKEEVEAFKAQTFTAGKIPTKPPPRELCS